MPILSPSEKRIPLPEKSTIEALTFKATSDDGPSGFVLSPHAQSVRADKNIRVFTIFGLIIICYKNESFFAHFSKVGKTIIRNNYFLLKIS